MYHHWRQGCLPEDASLPKKFPCSCGNKPPKFNSSPPEKWWLEDYFPIGRPSLPEKMWVAGTKWTMDMLFPILKVSYQFSCAFILSEQTKIAVALLGSTSTLQMSLLLNVCCGHVCLRQRNRLASRHNSKVLMTLFLLGGPCSLL